MARYSGKLGFAILTEIEPGVYEKQIVERHYYGDFITNSRRQTDTGAINDSLDLSNYISVVADAYASEHFHHLVYVTYSGSKWKARSAEVAYPRLLITTGDKYTGKGAKPNDNKE